MRFKEQLKDYKDIICYWCLKKIRIFRKSTLSNRILMLTLIILAAAGITGYAAGNSLTSSETKFLRKFHKLMLHPDSSEALKFIGIENNGTEINKQTLDPFFKYIQQTTTRSKAFIEALKKEPTKASIAVLKREKTLFGTKFQVELKPVYIDITAPYKGTEIYLQDNLITTSRENNFSTKLGPLVPGIYEVKGIYKNEYGQSTIEQTVSAITGTTSIILPLESRRFSLESNYEDAYVYLNGEKTDKQVKDFKNIGPFPGTDSIKFFIERDFPWGRITSTEIEVTTSSKVRLDINPLTPELKAQLDTSFKTFYQSLFNALSAEKPDLIKNAEDNVKKQMYSWLKDDSFIVKNSYSMKDIEYEQDIMELHPKEGSFTASANVTVAYKTSKKILVFNLPGSYTTISQKYKTTLTYNDDLKQWIVSAVTEI